MGYEQTADRSFSSCRERIAQLLDPKSFRELGSIAGSATYDASLEKLTGFVRANFVSGKGTIHGRPVIVGADGLCEETRRKRAFIDDDSDFLWPRTPRSRFIEPLSDFSVRGWVDFWLWISSTIADLFHCAEGTQTAPLLGKQSTRRVLLAN